ncbi:MAG: S1 RNA-binding domain-containing protein [Acidobacteria bacterium]|nr:S1 RNA-binding domain-containing protein [Acidobacteriota bacterium]
MSNPGSSEFDDIPEAFADVLSQFERAQAEKTIEGTRSGTVVSVGGDLIFVDIGLKTEGVLPRSEIQQDRDVKAGDKVRVTIKGRAADGYYQLTSSKDVRPADWAALEKAFAERTTIVGTVTGVVKGGLTVDVGVRAFLPASRSRARDVAEMQKLVEQEVRCRIIELDAASENVVVDCRAVAEEEEQAAKEQRYSQLREGETVSGTVRTLADYGAFVDIGGIDALLHVGDISWGRRVHNPADLLETGQELRLQILKIDREKHRVSVGLKQLQPHPWDTVPHSYPVGQRVRAIITRVTEFGAFAELEPGVEGLIHISEMSWVKNVKKPADLVKPGDTVEVLILAVNAPERRISLGLKQALGDPWTGAADKIPVGSVVRGTVVNLTKFGAFVALDEGLEGMIHVSDISAEKHLNHPQVALKVGQAVQAKVLELDPEKRRLRLGIKQLAPTSIDEYLAEHQEGDVVSGRVMEMSEGSALVELGEGIQAACRLTQRRGPESRPNAVSGARDLASLSSMLEARWKGAARESSILQEVAAGQVRSFRITKLDRAGKQIELELA